MSYVQSSARHRRPVETNAVDPALSLGECVARRAVLRAQQFEIDDAIDGIKWKLEAAESKEIWDGIPFDKDWHRRASDALRHYIRSHQEHETACNNLSRRIKQLQPETSLEMAFIEYARQMLPEQTYLEILSRAEQPRHGAAQEGY